MLLLVYRGDLLMVVGLERFWLFAKFSRAADTADWPSLCNDNFDEDKALDLLPELQPK